MRTRTKWLLAAPALIVAGLGLLYLLYELPIWLAGDTLDKLEPKDRLEATAALRGQFVPLLSVGLAALGFVCTARGFVYTARKFWLDRDGHYTDRFNTSIAHLDSRDNPVTRAGGAWALERIMQDSPRDRNRGRKALSYFLRESTRSGGATAPKPAGDIAAALDVLRTQPPSEADHRSHIDPLDLSGIRVHHADMRGMDVTAGSLARADLTDADLRLCTLDGADLEHANLIGANLRGASLVGTRLIGARLAGADLTGADLTGADLTGAGLTDAVLTTTILAGSTILEAIGLTSEQLATARLDAQTRLPPGLSPPS